MGTEKRERQKANRAAKQAAEQAAEVRRRRIQTIRNVVLAGVAIVVIMVLVSVLSGCASEPDTAGTASGDTTAGTAAGGPDACPPADGVDQPVIDFGARPGPCLDPAKAYQATIETTEGTVTVALDTERTPDTADNFATLARYGYYDGTTLFRTEADTGIIQGGSPHTQDNADPGPGYTIADEGGTFTSDDYAAGALAMARTSAPDSAGAQFFLLAGDGGRYLGDPQQLGSAAGTYVVFGHVTDGLDVLQRIAALDDGSGAPSTPVSITSIAITEA